MQPSEAMIEAARKKPCDHWDYVFDTVVGDHVCEHCRLRWRDTGQPAESKGYVFDRLLGP